MGEYKRWEPIPGYYGDVYIENCRKMIKNYQKKIEETKEMLETERHPLKREDLRRQLLGSEKWLELWIDWLAKAEKDKEEHDRMVGNV